MWWEQPKDNPMYIRDRADALDTLAEILDLPTRREQIIALTVKIVLCLEPDSRTFLADAQATLIEGGLEEMKRRRQELMAVLELSDYVVVFDPEEDALFEELASTQDALRLAEVFREVFPDIAQDYPLWLIIRAILQQEAPIQECIRKALRARRSEEEASRRVHAARLARELVELAQPVWADRAGAIREAVHHAVGSRGMVPPDQVPLEAEFLFTTIAAREERAAPFLHWLDHNPRLALEFVERLFELKGALADIETDAEETLAYRIPA